MFPVRISKMRNFIPRDSCKVRHFHPPSSGVEKENITLSAETIQVPQMAESITEGTLKSWSKQVGDIVAADEEVATIETDKASDQCYPSSTLNYTTYLSATD
jgi:hypothetical protein